MSAGWDHLYGVLPAELPQSVRYFVVFMIVRHIDERRERRAGARRDQSR